jgi:hypothetical protein
MGAREITAAVRALFVLLSLKILAPRDQACRPQSILTGVCRGSRGNHAAFVSALSAAFCKSCLAWSVGCGVKPFGGQRFGGLVGRPYLSAVIIFRGGGRFRENERHHPGYSVDRRRDPRLVKAHLTFRATLASDVMRPLKLRPLTRRPSVPARRWYRVLLLAGFASGSAAWAASGVALTFDCAFCGPGQSFPHDCPRVSSSAEIPTAIAFSTLVDTARRETSRLRAISGLSLPELGEVATLAQLDAALTNLIAATGDEIARCERERTDYLHKSATADAENAHLAHLVHQLNDEIAQSRAAIVETESEAAAQIRAASAARDEILKLQKSLGEIREEIRQVRNRLFPLLHQAAYKGWILPPSSYRPIPAPLPPRTRLGANVNREELPANAPVSTLDRRGLPHAIAVPIATRPSVGSSSRADVQARIDQLPALWERARAAAARRDDAIRTLEHQRSAMDAQSTRLSALQPQRAAVANQLAAAKRNLAMARQAHTERADRLSTTRATAVHAWIEWGIFHLLEKKAASLLAGTERESAEAEFLDAWRDVADVAVRLGSDPLGVIIQLPVAPTVPRQDLDALRRNLAGMREKFGLGFARKNSDVPPTARPYFTEESP